MQASRLPADDSRQPARVVKLDLVFPDRGHAVDGIGDYTECLARTMRARSSVDPTVLRVRTGRDACRAMLRRRSTDAVLIQYMPFSWGRWGFAPWLVLTVAALRLTRRTLIAVMVHECYVEVDNARSAVMGGWQRVQLRLLLRLSHARGASTTSFCERLKASWPRMTVERIPSSTPFTNARRQRDAHRRRNGWTDEDIVLCTMSSGHWSRISGHVGIAASGVAASVGRCTLVVLGPDAAAPDNLDERVQVVRPGFLQAADVGPWIAACDVYLAAYVDGVSARRTSFLAGLQQGVAVVGTKGRSTDPEFLDCPGLRLTAADDASAFAAAAVAVATDRNLRAAMASHTGELFDQRYSFTAVTDQWLGQLGLARQDAGQPSI